MRGRLQLRLIGIFYLHADTFGFLVKNIINKFFWFLDKEKLAILHLFC